MFSDTAPVLQPPSEIPLDVCTMDPLLGQDPESRCVPAASCKVWSLPHCPQLHGHLALLHPKPQWSFFIWEIRIRQWALMDLGWQEVLAQCGWRSQYVEVERDRRVEHDVWEEKGQTFIAGVSQPWPSCPLSGLSCQWPAAVQPLLTGRCSV